MLSELDRYIAAGTRDNTRRSYQAAVEHFEVSWGGFLPATSTAVADYLVAYAGKLSLNTLRLRLAALAQWHLSQGFLDPTKSPVVKQVLKGIRTLHPQQEKQAEPLQLLALERCIGWLEKEAEVALIAQDHKRLLRSRRDRALILLGFWRAFRSEELCRLEVEFIQVKRGEGMRIFLPWSKGDRDSNGATYAAPALERLCPVEAYNDWISTAGIAKGPVFRGIDRWGRLSDQALHPYSVAPILREALAGAGVAGELYSSHSLRRGFANWASQSGWDQKSLMSYVGWKDSKSALRYVDARMEFQLPPATPLIAE
ncbi:site-specific integrase [Pseudomonas sp. LS1212]|uniref:site-specific integrase n=1 Tax=Pseudomonas sp. LS1212 TaxID=2972478 RepID=UPI00215D154B|nr:site-specific integrase [Pseudomonas sp. LS1212]UVJ41938.1 site-specific integrase [Pseudomonas sp. LS1212]